MRENCETRARHVTARDQDGDGDGNKDGTSPPLTSPHAPSRPRPPRASPTNQRAGGAARRRGGASGLSAPAWRLDWLFVAKLPNRRVPCKGAVSQWRRRFLFRDGRLKRPGRRGLRRRHTLCRMSSDEKKSTTPVFPDDCVQDSSVSSDSQDEYKELFHFTVTAPKFEQCVSKLPDPASEQRPPDRVSRLTDESSHRSNPVSTSVKQAGMEQPALPETISSTHDPREVSKTTVTELTSPGGEVTQIENIVDLCSGSFKTNILTELKNWELNLIQHHKLQMRQEKAKHATQVKQLQNEMENLKELLHTYEISISRKDEVIINLTRALGKQKERAVLLRAFTQWRIQHVKAKQEEYAIRMADRHFQTTLMKKAWAAWHSVSEERRKDEVARACQLRAEDVCVQLASDCEAKIAELTAALEMTRAAVLRLHTERDEYEDTIKKAFMRGVCALNLEAITMFQSKDSRPDPDIGSRRNDHATTGAGRPPPSQYNQPSPPPPPAAALQMENMFCSHLAHASTPETRLDSDSPVIVTSTTSGSGATSTQKLQTISRVSADKYP
ncbi:centrosomal protein POC5 isoform X2 [Taeniopygia guttata]|uniref:centrosomal protein POC5 isoform X2 n=1 Tax=Taeniopygia guttata TaxID=59729 RepID=UPI003BB88AD5